MKYNYILNFILLYPYINGGPMLNYMWTVVKDLRGSGRRWPKPRGICGPKDLTFYECFLNILNKNHFPLDIVGK